MYPILNIESVISHATNLCRFMEAAVRQGLMAADTGPANQGIKDENTNVLKMVLAIALTVEGSGQSDSGNRLFESVKGAADAILHSESVNIKNLPLLVLVVSLSQISGPSGKTSPANPANPSVNCGAHGYLGILDLADVLPIDDVSFPSR
jgi:hypothetical protein